MAVVVRYFDESSKDVCDALFDSLIVEDGSAQGLYTSLKAMFTEAGIPLTNIIGFGSDNCNTMLGKTGGFQAFLRTDVPNVFVLGCVCHSFALCASYAVKHLPSWLENFLKDVSAYFSRSSKRQ